MTAPLRPDGEEEDVVFLDDGTAEDVARALAEAERAVAAVEERRSHRPASAPVPAAAGPETPAEPDQETVVELEAEPAAPAPPAAVPSGEVAALKDLLSTERERAVVAEEEAGRLREALVRKAADFENLKRRTEREKADHSRFALAEIARELLGVLDNFERAMSHAPAAGSDDFRFGIEMIARQLGETLRRFGVVEVAALGSAFDPNFHEAVMREESGDVAPGTVLEVFQKGYLLGERLLRPALVKVAVARPAPPEPPA